jgi:hypothetical protein
MMALNKEASMPSHDFPDLPCEFVRWQVDPNPSDPQFLLTFRTTGIETDDGKPLEARLVFIQIRGLLAGEGC